MRKQSRKLILLLIVMLASIGMSACGNGGDNSPAESNGSSNPADSGAASQESVKSGEKVTVSFLNWAAGGEKASLERAIKQFNETHPNITIKAEFVPRDKYETKLNTLVAAGSPPDLAYMPEVWNNLWGEKGTLVDLNPYIEASPDFEKQIGSFTSQGKTWGLWFGAVLDVLYYNKKMFEDAGIEPPSSDPSTPWTWDQMLDAARKLTVDANGKHPNEEGFDKKKIRSYGILIPTWWGGMEALMRSNEGGYATEDGNESLINSPESIEVIQKIADLSNKEFVAPDVVAQKALPNGNAMLQNNQLGMYLSGHWETSTFGEAKYDVGYAAIPYFKKPVNIVWAAGTAMFSGSKHKDEAWEALKYLANAESNIGVYQDGVWIPTIKSWFSEEAKLKSWTDNDRHNEQYIQVVKNTILNDIAVFPGVMSLKNYDKIDKEISAVLGPVWEGKKTAEEALKGVDAKIKPFLQGVYK